LFATRYPYRPNPLGLSLVQLIVRKENTLEIQGVDMLEGTPLLDIKPYVPEFDIRLDTRSGWYDSRIK
jgi:tRNA (Thr-GGU) A37 N-methylase